MVEWIHDRQGRAVILFDNDCLRDRQGRVIAWISGNNLYSLQGHHIGWFEGRVVYDSRNRALGFLRNHTGYLPSLPGLGGLPGIPGMAVVPADQVLAEYLVALDTVDGQKRLLIITFSQAADWLCIAGLHFYHSIHLQWYIKHSQTTIDKPLCHLNLNAY